MTQILLSDKLVSIPLTMVELLQINDGVNEIRIWSKISRFADKMIIR